MYAVGLNTQDRKFSMTCRDLDKSPHWKMLDGIPKVIRDSRNPEFKPYTVLGEFNTESEARKFKAVVEAAYVATGYEQDYINA